MSIPDLRKLCCWWNLYIAPNGRKCIRMILLRVARKAESYIQDRHPYGEVKRVPRQTRAARPSLRPRRNPDRQSLPAHPFLERSPARTGYQLANWFIHRRIELSDSLMLNACMREAGRQLDKKIEKLQDLHSQAYMKRVDEV
jgi:hypothetical protein